jgi:formylmethanofuran dehydrogenase subunit E
MDKFKDVISFHGHTCPGLALGYRVALCALNQLGDRAADEELVAIVENNSCAVDAIQVVTGCTFGKGNLIFKDYGKQVYTFLRRPSQNIRAKTTYGVRISVKRKPQMETSREKTMWGRYMKGDRSDEVLETVHQRKSKKINAILNARDEELFIVKKERLALPREAEILPSITCETCGEKVMESRAKVKAGKIVCIPCFNKKKRNEG